MHVFIDPVRFEQLQNVIPRSVSTHPRHNKLIKSFIAILCTSDENGEVSFGQ
jgi:hypothetical protein